MDFVPMSENSLYIFVKGRAGKAAFEITDEKFNCLHYQINEPLLNKEGGKIFHGHADLKAIEASLEYLVANRGKNGIPELPSIFLFTTYELHYHIAVGLKKPRNDILINFKENIEKLKDRLHRNSVSSFDDVKFYWIPEGFENRFEHVNQLLDGEPPSLKP